MERDLQLHYGVDLRTEFAERRWGKLLNLIDNMPRPSLYLEARATDPEIAQALLFEMERNPSLESTAAERFSEWTPLMYLVAQLADLQQQTVAAVLATANGGKFPQLRPIPRPRGALEAAREARHREFSERLRSRLVPKMNSE